MKMIIYIKKAADNLDKMIKMMIQIIFYKLF